MLHSVGATAEPTTTNTGSNPKLSETTEAEIAKARGEARRIGWPCWSGPHTTFAALPTDHELVDDLNDARLVWRSEEVTPLAKAHAARSRRYSAGRHGGNQDDEASGGGGSPVLSDGRLFLSYYVPTGDVLAPATGRIKSTDGRRILADDVVLCIDANSGETLWKRVFEEQGVNLQDHKSPGYSGLTPCIANGRIYTVGSTLRIRCFETKTGKLIWETPTPKATDYIESQTPEALDEGKFVKNPFLAKQGGKNLIVAGGVLLVPVQNDLLGVDGESGRVLWTIRRALGSTATPTRWTHGNQQFAIAANEEGTIRCIDPRTGDAVWTIDDAGPNAVNVTVDGDLLIGRARKVEVPVKGRNKPEIRGLLGAWRITPKSATLVWKHEEPRYVLHHFHVPIPSGGHVYVPSSRRGPLLCIESASGKVVAEEQLPVGTLPGTNVLADGHLICETDGSHMSMNLHLIRAEPGDLKQLGETWQDPHPPTTSYVPALCHPYVDGRLFVRGADGVYCYDLRKPGAVSE